MPAVLDVQDLRTYYRTSKGLVKAVDGVSFHINEGETIGIVGENGCGKSEAMLSTVQLIQKPGEIVEGRVILDGQDILRHEANSPAMRSVRGSKISFISQKPQTSLNPSLSISRQIAELLKLHLDMDIEASRERAIELLEAVGIPDASKRIDDRPNKFSSGMLRRVMIAMAVSCNPRIVIADEPTGATDLILQARLMELLTGLVKQLNTSLIMVTHNLGTVARYTRRIYVMYAGRIVESGPCEVVFNSPRHPYTLGLLCSVPRLGENRSSRKLVPIPGSPPNLIKLPPYCAFLPRCTHKTERCEKDPWPDLRQVGEGHYISCYADLRETL